MRADRKPDPALFLNSLPLMDTRAPVEFAKGAFPGAVNLPLMNDREREQVGLCYAREGQQAALELGHRLVSGPLRQARLQAWADFARAHPEGYLYCFRGGLRSQIVQTWLRTEAGIDYPRIEGGYKAMRSLLLDTLERGVAECGLLVLGGMTGTGKTEVLQRLPDSLDLEGHARHRGSSFGRQAEPQPAQIDFDNQLAIDMLRKRHAGWQRFLVEDEGQAIGSCSLPAGLYRRMQQSPMVWLEDSREQRIERILRDYVIDLCAALQQQAGPQAGFEDFARRLRDSLDRIQKRLGGLRHRQLAASMDAALAEQGRSGRVDLHREWIAGLLAQYYDPMYAYQRTLKQERIVFAGEREAVLEYLRASARQA
ncbi:tRNA 2-selenouridine(34) synthase MnmH [Bordetella trematum]|uniref:tRNA 2-selenouridine(34) synthase MnmH n=1 Tax=Bordetella trematum TaxID=123899 RepID=UPI003AF40A32